MVSFSAFRFRIATKPLPVKGTDTEIREGILLRSEANPEIWSEASPLPGFSCETLDDVIASLECRSKNVPSLDFAIDCLTSDFPQAGEIPVCALLAENNREHFLAQARRLSDSAFAAVKLKVGRLAIEEDVLRVRLLREALRGDQSIRLDANRSWELDIAIRFAQQISDCNIDLIEEPVSDPVYLEEFYLKTKFPFALDETLMNERVDLSSYPNASAFIVKPTVLGQAARIKKIMAIGKPIIFSSVFESGIGIYQIGRMAAACSKIMPVGLDTYRWLKEDVLLKQWDFDDGYFRFTGPPKIDETRLTPIK